MCVVLSALKELNDLNNLLAEYCQQKLPNDFKAEIGQPCCAFFVGKFWEDCRLNNSKASSP